jgi:outer membrane protein OmpA-like peptidoglycan-associated protein
MMLSIRKKTDAWDKKQRNEPENFWIAYSDLMAGLLMIFALTTIVTVHEFNSRLKEPTQILTEWKKVVEELKQDNQLKELIKQKKIQINDSGALVITNNELRFPFDKATLPEEGKEILRSAVPKYLNVIKKHEEFVKRIGVIEIAGHTDMKDEGRVNPIRSRQRAGSVLSFLLEEETMTAHRSLIETKAITAGYAAIRLPSTCRKEEACDEARRVEITIKLDEEKVLKEVHKILIDVDGTQ